jgi:hypothetical protein
MVSVSAGFAIVLVFLDILEPAGLGSLEFIDAEMFQGLV